MASPNTRRDVSKSYSDLYNTPVEALEALYDKVTLDLNKTYFEPCNGKGKISGWFTENFGTRMTTNELFSEHGSSDYNEDFLNPDDAVAKKWDFDYIVTNPPFKIASEFVQEGFKYAKEQYHFLRLNFLEGQKRQDELFCKSHLKNVYIFTKRVSCSKGVEEEPQANAVCYAWYHFDRDYEGSPTLHWI